MKLTPSLAQTSLGDLFVYVSIGSIGMVINRHPGRRARRGQMMGQMGEAFEARRVGGGRGLFPQLAARTKRTGYVVQPQE